MTPFIPAGERARWRVLYDLVRKLDIGDLVTYEELADALELDPADDRHTVQVNMRRTITESEMVDNRTLEAVRGLGYRVVEPEGHLRIARGHQRKSRRALARSERVSTHVDLTGMEPEVRKAFELVVTAVKLQSDYARRLDIQQRNLAQAVKEVTQQRERSDEEVRGIRDRLERLERRLGTTS